MYDLARVDLPDPGAPIIMVLCRPAAAISAFRLAVCSPFKFRKFLVWFLFRFLMCVLRIYLIKKHRYISFDKFE